MASLDIPVSFLLNQDRPLLSLEFFPPKTPGHAEELLKTAGTISTHLRPDFVSITDGAGGSTRKLTYLYSQLLKERFGWTVVPHLTCLGRTSDELLAIAESYLRLGIRNVMCLRGDKPQHPPLPLPQGGNNNKGLSPLDPLSEMGTNAPKIDLGSNGGMGAPPPNIIPSPREGQGVGVVSELSHASELVALLKKEFPDLCMGVAGYPEKHPEAPSLQEDILHLKEKVDCGATWITTQMFFNPDAYGNFVKKCREAGITQAIIPGLLPVQSIEQTKRFCAMSAAEIPPELSGSLRAMPGEEQWEAGVVWTLKTIERLRQQKAPGIHLYILNKSKSLLKIARCLSEKGFFGSNA